MNGQERILIVEDNALIAMDLEDELAERGYPSVCAGSVADAMRVLERETPRMALLDIQLKSETSFDLALHLKEHDIPFVFLSGNDASALPVDLRSATILSKPVHVDMIVATIDKVAARS